MFKLGYQLSRYSLLPMLTFSILIVSYYETLAGSWDFWAKLIRRTAKVSDNVPLHVNDEAVRRLAKSRAIPEAIEAELKSSGKLPQELKGASREAVWKAEVSRLLTGVLERENQVLLHDIAKLDPTAQETALILCRGGKTMEKALPDLALRGRLLQSGGPELVTAVGLHGKDAAFGAMRLESAIKSGTLVVPTGVRAVTLADFGSAMTKFGRGSWEFWNKYVVPHWGKWLASGALAAYLIAPETFQDTMGSLTENGFKHLTELAGNTAAAAIRGIGQGSDSAVDKITDAAKETYFSGTKSAYAIGMTVVFLLVGSILIPTSRSLWIRGFKRFFSRRS